MQAKRLFFGLEVEAPWPSKYPEGRIISEECRHATLAFLGQVDFEQLAPQLANCPLPSFPFTPIGRCDQLLFLPEMHPRVVSWHVSWLTCGSEIIEYQKKLLDWLETLDFQVDRRPFLSHVTLARAPFDERDWEREFEKLPLVVKGLHLYESVGNLNYPSIWQKSFVPAFEEIPHTADIAYLVRGRSFQELYLHAAAALSFKHPSILEYVQEQSLDSLLDLIRALNLLVSLADQETGCPFKAVSYHGRFKSDAILEWEMVVDV